MKAKIKNGLRILLSATLAVFPLGTVKSPWAALGAAALVLLQEEYAQTAVPQMLNFQGRLTDQAGAPVTDGQHTVTFRLYDADAPGGSLLWAEESH